MKRFLAPFFAVAFLCSCTTFAVPPNPAAVADATTLDERGLLGAELLYKAARTAAEAAADAGLVDAPLAMKIKALDNRLHGLLGDARKAYGTANAASYNAALDEIAPLIGELWLLARGKEPANG